MMIDLTGQRFERLTVLRKGGQYRSPCGRSTSRKWICRCDCGNELEIITASLRGGLSRSCGCLQRERAAAAHRKHGGSDTVLYNIWFHMLSRCQTPTNHDYRYYGARGITVCERWQEFENFRADMGEPPPGLTLDRRDNDRGYSPDNCRWATRAEQSQNKRAWGTA